MRRWLVLFFALLLPLQFAWTASSAYCEHEITEPQSNHFGHHFHAHKGAPTKSSDSKLMADSDCASCHASAAAAISARLDRRDFAVASPAAEPGPSRPFSSVLSRAPDRPQWLRLV